jgi:G3E family GTPase
MSARIPVTVLTGFLGSGKTSLLNRILSASHGQRIAVIENEFGEIGVDQELVIDAQEEIFELNNGCICCTVRGDLIRILGNLARRQEKFDRIVLETTGLANPGPVAQTFFVDEGIRGTFVLDGIVTLVDARHVERQWLESDEVRTQIAFADVVVLNKCDLVGATQLDALERRVRGVNALAKIVRADPRAHAAVSLEAVLGIGGFDLDRALEQQPRFLEPEYPFEWGGGFDLRAGGDYSLTLQRSAEKSMDVVLCPVMGADGCDPTKAAERVFTLFSKAPQHCQPGDRISAQPRSIRLDLPGAARFALHVQTSGHYWLFTQHTPEEVGLTLRDADGTELHARVQSRFDAGHSHDERVRSCSMTADRPLVAERFQAWVSGVLQSQGTRLYRMKGFVDFAGADRRTVIQGVHMMIDTRDLGPWGERPRRSQLVLIGRDLETAALQEGFAACQSGAPAERA